MINLSSFLKHKHWYYNNNSTSDHYECWNFSKY